MTVVIACALSGPHEEDTRPTHRIRQSVRRNAYPVLCHVYKPLGPAEGGQPALTELAVCLSLTVCGLSILAR